MPPNVAVSSRSGRGASPEAGEKTRLEDRGKERFGVRTRPFDANLIKEFSASAVVSRVPPLPESPLVWREHPGQVAVALA